MCLLQQGSEMGAPLKMGRGGVGCRVDPAALGSGGGHFGTSSLSALLGQDRLHQEWWPRSGQLQQLGRAEGRGPTGRWSGRTLRTRPASPLPDPAWEAPVLGGGPGHTSSGCVWGEGTACHVHRAAPGNPASEIGRS